jgi:hypothetical protein
MEVQPCPSLQSSGEGPQAWAQPVENSDSFNHFREASSELKLIAFPEKLWINNLSYSS